MAHDEATEANRVPWLPSISRYAYRFVAGDRDQHARMHVTVLARGRSDAPGQEQGLAPDHDDQQA